MRWKSVYNKLNDSPTACSDCSSNNMEIMLTSIETFLEVFTLMHRQVGSAESNEKHSVQEFHLWKFRRKTIKYHNMNVIARFFCVLSQFYRWMLSKIHSALLSKHGKRENYSHFYTLKHSESLSKFCIAKMQRTLCFGSFSALHYLNIQEKLFSIQNFLFRILLLHRLQ